MVFFLDLSFHIIESGWIIVLIGFWSVIEVDERLGDVVFLIVEGSLIEFLRSRLYLNDLFGVWLGISCDGFGVGLIGRLWVGLFLGRLLFRSRLPFGILLIQLDVLEVLLGQASLVEVLVIIPDLFKFKHIVLVVEVFVHWTNRVKEITLKF